MSALPDVLYRRMTLEGYMPIMFDRYPGDNKTTLPVGAKFYFLPDGKTICIPASNIVSFLSATNTSSAAKLVGGKTYKALAAALLGFVQISPMSIPITREGKPIQFSGFVNDRDEDAQAYVDRRVARLPRGIPNPKERPVLELPWEASFDLTMFKNDEFDEEALKVIFAKGGIALGLGTFRGLFGKFIVKEWTTREP